MNTESNHPMYIAEKSHEPIIDREIFDAVQAEKLRRSNVVTDATGNHRKGKKYSAKNIR